MSSKVFPEVFMTEEHTDFKSIIRLDSELNQIQDLDLLLERILLEARKVVHADAGSIYVKENGVQGGEPIELLVIKYSQNDTTQKGLPPGQKMIYSIFSVPINEKTISGYCAFTKKLVNIPDAYAIPPDAPYLFGSSFDKISGYRTTSVLAVPLVTAEGRLFGVIQVLNAKDKNGRTVPFSADDELLMTHFAANATVALQRASVTRTMILRMIKMSELRDPKETGTHVNRVAGYAVELYDRWAYRHNVSGQEREKFRDTLKIAAMLHDVGKVAISDVILKKPGRFTPEEYLIMQHHTIYGAALFDDPQSPLDNVSRDIALTHHENWDGTGYPGWVDVVTEIPLRTDENGKALGRKGEEIPLEGRIVAIADVFDALCSRRVYKDPWGEEQVLTEIRHLSGTKFDPELVDIFFEILPNIKQIQNLYPESA
jgi:HD-GYP domain-containing protein (c-di-GMP phosphodiesterase class II)